jgi:serine/threonine protein kinase/tetratricopeptide (TPR) repeat protein
MLCPHCGAQTAATAGECGVCRTPVDPAAAASPETASPETASPTPARPAGPSEGGIHSLPTTPRSPADLRRAAGQGPLVPGEAFGARYRILEQLGGGGMGVVYKAWDETIGLEVAIKVIRPAVMADPSHARDLERRFKRELVLARQVTHKNVVRIHDLGEIDGIKYITMSYVDGVDLATILRRERKIPIPRALSLARRIVAGLKAAHDAGVVHRDLKPSNVMVDAEDEPLIMDFGIARSASARPEPASGEGKGPSAAPHGHHETWAGSTVPGAIVGTLEYMAPEQASGLAVDQRADIYAFGLILYDMLVGTGHHKARRRGMEALRERAHQAPLSPRSLEPEIPAALDRVVTRCQATDPADRYQSAGELEADLLQLDDHGHPLPVAWRIGRRHLVAAGLAGGMALAGTWWFARTPPPPAEPAPLSVLIADFENHTGDPVFDGSLEQPLAVGIEAASFINAYPRHNAQQLAAEITRQKVLDESAARLVSMREDIKVVLAGSVAADGSGYSISVRGIDPAVDDPVFTARVSAAGKDEVLDGVGSLAERVRRALGDTAARGEADRGRETFTAASLEAARSYARAQELQMAYRDEEAMAHYERAIELDPNFGRAYAAMANSAFRLGRLEESKAAWEKALSLIDRMTEREKYRTLGVYYGTVSRNYDKVIENYETLLQLYPADSTGHNNLALAYFNTRRFDEALEEGRRALDIHPHRLLYQGNHALFAMYASDFETAEDEARRIVDKNPEYYPAYLPLAVGALARSDFAAARQAYERMGETGMPGVSLAPIGLADLASYRGHFAKAVEILDGSLAADEKAGRSAFRATKLVALAEACQASGRQERALASLRDALELRRLDEVLLPAARALLKAGRTEEAAALARELHTRLEPQSRAYARIIDGEIALGEDRTVDALEAFRGAQELADPWLVHLDLGVFYAKAGRFAEALFEFETCEKRKGEATALFLDDVPTFRSLATVPYWLGRVQDGLGMTKAASDSYARFLALRDADTPDPLVAEVRERQRRLSAGNGPSP